MSDSGAHVDDAGAPPRRGRRTLVVGLGLAALVVVGIAAVALTRDGQSGGLPTGGMQQPGRSLAGDPLPDLTLDGFDGGEPVALADYRGRPLVVNLWATWCAPCVAEMPDFAELSGELGDAVAIVGVDTMDAPSSAKAFVEELGIPYDLVADPDARLFDAVGGYGMPTTLFVDAEGTIVQSQTGPYDLEGLRDAVREHLDVGS